MPSPLLATDAIIHLNAMNRHFPQSVRSPVAQVFLLFCGPPLSMSAFRLIIPTRRPNTETSRSLVALRGFQMLRPIKRPTSREDEVARLLNYVAIPL